MINEQERSRIANRIQELRKTKNMSQDELAVRSGLHRPHISRIEKGAYSITLETLSAVANALGCTVELVEKTGQ